MCFKHPEGRLRFNIERDNADAANGLKEEPRFVEEDKNILQWDKYAEGLTSKTNRDKEIVYSKMKVSSGFSKPV